MGTVHWLEYPEPGYVCLYFSEGYASAECGSTFEAFHLVVDSYLQGQLTETETLELIEELKEFEYLDNEPFDFILINLWITEEHMLDFFEFDICNSCTTCKIKDRKKPHGYFSYEEKTPNDGRKKLRTKIPYLIDSKDEAYFVIKILVYFELITEFTAELVKDVIDDSSLTDNLDPPQMPKLFLN